MTSPTHPLNKQHIPGPYRGLQRRPRRRWTSALLVCGCAPLLLLVAGCSRGWFPPNSEGDPTIAVTSPRGPRVGQSTTNLLDPSALPSLRTGIFAPMGYDPTTLERQWTEEVSTWRNLLHAEGASVTLIDALAEVDLSGFEVLIVPWTERMETEELAALFRFVKGGGFLVYSGIVASANPFVNQTRQWSFERAMGLFYTSSPAGGLPQRLHQKETLGGVIAIGNTPITAGIPPTYTVALSEAAPRVTARWSNPGYYAPLEWFGTAAEGPQRSRRWAQEAAAVVGDIGEGRFLWLGFPITSIQGSLSNQQAWQAIVRNALAYGRHQPIASVSWWPQSYRSAAVLSMDIERNQDIALRAIEAFRQVQLPATTMFILSSLAEQSSTLLRSFAEHGEVSLMESGMARNNDFEVQMSILQNQETRLKAAMASAAPLQAWSLSGIRLPELQYDYRTFFAFAQIGYDYCYLHESRNGSMPWWQGFGPAHGIVVIPSFAPDDFEIFHVRERSGPEAIFAEASHEFDNIRRAGGLFAFSTNAQHMNLPGMLEATERLAAYVQRPAVWVTSFSELGRWMKARLQLQAKAQNVDRNTFSLEIRNYGSVAAGEFEVEIYLPQPTLALSAYTWEGHRGLIVPRLHPSGRSVMVRLDGLGPFEQRNLLLRKSTISADQTLFPSGDNRIPIRVLTREEWLKELHSDPERSDLPIEGFPMNLPSMQMPSGSLLNLPQPRSSESRPWEEPSRTGMALPSVEFQPPGTRETFPPYAPQFPRESAPPPGASAPTTVPPASETPNPIPDLPMPSLMDGGGVRTVIPSAASAPDRLQSDRPVPPITADPAGSGIANVPTLPSIPLSSTAPLGGRSEFSPLTPTSSLDSPVPGATPRIAPTHPAELRRRMAAQSRSASRIKSEESPQLPPFRPSSSLLDPFPGSLIPSDQMGVPNQLGPTSSPPISQGLLPPPQRPVEPTTPPTGRSNLDENLDSLLLDQFPPPEPQPERFFPKFQAEETTSPYGPFFP